MCTSEIAIKKNQRVISHLLNFMLSAYTKNGKKIAPSSILATYLFNKKLFTKLAGAIPNSYSTNPYLYIHELVSRFTPRVDVVTLGEKGKPFLVPMPPAKKNLLKYKFMINVVKQTRNITPWRRQIVQRLISVGDELHNSKGQIFQESKDVYRVLKQHRSRAKKRYISQVKKRKVIKNAITKSFQHYI